MLAEYRNYHEKTFYNKILFETEHYIVVPSLGALIEGWLLIVPKEEYLSFQYIDNDSLLEELEALSQRLVHIMKNEYGYVTMFEHGPLKPNTTVGCSVDYAHLHVVPINFDLIEGLETFLQIKYEWQKISSLKAAFKTLQNKSEYLFLKDSNGNSYIVKDKKIPSQLFRKVIANFLNKPEEFDWKKFHQEENISKTIERLQKYLIN